MIEIDEYTFHFAVDNISKLRKELKSAKERLAETPDNSLCQTEVCYWESRLKALEDTVKRYMENKERSKTE